MRLDASGTEGPDWDGAVVVALGGNLAGDYASPLAALEAALDEFAGVGLKIVERSSWWRSASWPDPTLPDYLNAVVLVETTLGPAETLEALHRIEASFGRERSAANAPRVLDLDLIAHGRTVNGEGAAPLLPHPRAAERLFVMGPLAEIAPRWRHPVSGRAAAELAAAASVGRDARPV
jgi:2-amino-4-hydroxy-6-hydroxymethyldihydropteridine diphosphokinase